MEKRWGRWGLNALCVAGVVVFLFGLASIACHVLRLDRFWPGLPEVELSAAATCASAGATILMVRYIAYQADATRDQAELTAQLVGEQLTPKVEAYCKKVPDAISENCLHLVVANRGSVTADVQLKIYVGTAYSDDRTQPPDASQWSWRLAPEAVPEGSHRLSLQPGGRPFERDLPGSVGGIYQWDARTGKRIVRDAQEVPGTDKQFIWRVVVVKLCWRAHTAFGVSPVVYGRPDLRAGGVEELRRYRIPPHLRLREQCEHSDEAIKNLDVEPPGERPTLVNEFGEVTNYDPRLWAAVVEEKGGAES